MALLRILLIALLVWLILGMIRARINQHKQRRNGGQKPLNTVVRCQHCGLHIPKQEAIVSANKYYCCQDHRQLDQGGP